MENVSKNEPSKCNWQQIYIHIHIISNKIGTLYCCALLFHSYIMIDDGLMWFIHLYFLHDDIMKWKHFPLYWPFVWGIHRWPTQRPVTWSFDVFFDLHLNKQLSKQSRRWWFKMPSRSLWHHCNVQECFTVIGAIVSLPQCQWNNHAGCGHNWS